MHEYAILTGGTVPAHVPGAYPRLSCCGGPVQLVPVVDDDEARPVRQYRIGDRVRIRPHASTSFAGEHGTVTALFHVEGQDWTINVRPEHSGGLSLPFAASQVELAEVGDYMVRALQERGPVCELCGKPDGTVGPSDWNPETGNHATCEERVAEQAEARAARLAARG